MELLDIKPGAAKRGDYKHQLPHWYGITHAWQIGAEQQLNALRLALQQGLGIVQLRERALPEPQRTAFAKEAIELCRCFGAQVLVNSDLRLAFMVNADGVHLSASLLKKIEQRPAFRIVGASCHDTNELDAAMRLGCDFAVLGPVAATNSHPGQAPIGWGRFSACLAALPSTSALPIYALGGLNMLDLPQALKAGAMESLP